MYVVAGGLWLGGMLGWALLGFLPGMVLIALGAGAAAVAYYKEKKAASWRAAYPSYKY